MSSDWNWVGKPDGSDLPSTEEAVGAAPLDVQAGKGEFLPKTPRTDRCRICGEVKVLTREHIPPRSAFNKGRFQNQSFEDWLEAGEAGAPTQMAARGPVHQGGISAYTLCGDCNNLVGVRYADEYKGWAIRAAQMVAQPPHPRDLDAKVDPFGVTVEFDNVRPGAFVRAVLAAMCSVSSSWDIAGLHPVILRMILDGESASLPDECGLYLGFFLGQSSRLCGPQLAVDRVSGDWSWLIEVSHPPLTNLMRLAGGKEPHMGLLDISEWTKLDPKATASLEATFLVGFGRTPYPGDYRSRAQVLGGAS